METINNIELTDKSLYPDERLLRTVLGKSYAAYCALLGLYDRHQMQYEWRYYNDARAWLCKVQKKKKTNVWMSAWKGYMQATVYFPERLIEQIYTLPIDKEMKERIKKTRNVGKSKPCIFEIRDHHILKDMDIVMQFKIKAK
ncbi:DUF3788 family protein [Prosthecochloris sp.]|uniref:DUF3788 family protein n=1 Tax=Prosthecochloris sp. TaxID=290513 RepID=UPI0025D0A541|nr:DUF3788 family protein [Prosthecochloris sp.]